MNKVYMYILVMFAVSYALRVLPLTLIRKNIKNQFLQSFLYYVPYVTLALLTFPAITQVTENPFAGYLALLIGVIVAWRGANLFKVALSCSATVLIISLLF